MNRRNFLQSSTGALPASLALVGAGKGLLIAPVTSLESDSATRPIPAIPSDDGKKPLRLGLIIGIGKDPDAALAKVSELGLPTSQIFVEEFEPEIAGRLRQALDKYKIEATSVVVGGPGKEVWDFYQGPLTIGVVPRETRAARVAHIKKASDFARQCGIPAVQTHCGFIPENPNDDLYKETVETIRDIAECCRRNGQSLRYETGQETPITLIRTIQD